MQLRRTVLALTAAASVICGSLAAASAAETKVQNADKLKESLKKLYGKLEWEDTIARSSVMGDLVSLLSKEKDKKSSALKTTTWWSDQILESLYTGEKFIKTQPKTKEILKTEIEFKLQGEEGPPSKSAVFYRGPNGYARGRSAPLLVTIVDSKTDPKAWIEKSWASNEEIAKEWILAAVAESEAFDVAKDKISVARIVAKISQMFNVDPNRIYLEGVGAACRSAQIAASLAVPDRLAGLLLRNPADAGTMENCGLFPTVVVKGPEVGEKASAVFAKYKEAYGEAKAIELTAADTASLDGPCAGLTEWLKAAKPRETPRSYSWTATFDKDNVCPNLWTGTLWIVSPIKREEPTKLMNVTYSRETNTVDIKCSNLGEFEVCMNDELLDLDKEVAIFVNGNPMAKRVFERSVEAMLLHADNFWEYGRLFPVKFRAFVPTSIPAPDKKDGGAAPAPGGGDKK